MYGLCGCFLLRWDALFAFSSIFGQYTCITFLSLSRHIHNTFIHSFYSQLYLEFVLKSFGHQVVLSFLACSCLCYPQFSIASLEVAFHFCATLVIESFRINHTLPVWQRLAQNRCLTTASGLTLMVRAQKCSLKKKEKDK